jgi:hypothetical protein
MLPKGAGRGSSSALWHETAPQVECGRREPEGREEREGGGVLVGILAGRPLRRPVAQNPVDGGHTRRRPVATHP